MLHDLKGYAMSNSGIDWKRHDENYLYRTLGHYAVYDRPDRKAEHRSPMQRAMRQIKELRGRRFHYHINRDGTCQSLDSRMHQSWFQLPATQKEEWLLRHVDWSGVSERTREKVIAWQLRSRDGEINARDEWHLHDQLTRVESTTHQWSELSSTAKLETLLRSKDVDWRPFPREFQAIALGYMIRRLVRPTEEGFEIAGVFEAKGDYPHFGRYGHSKDRDAFEQSKRKGPMRPVFSKATAREQFKWSIAEPCWDAFRGEHRVATAPATGDGLRQEFRERMRPLWREFWAAAKKLNREGMCKLAWDRRQQTLEAFQERGHRIPSPGDIARSRGVERPGQDCGRERGIAFNADRDRGR
jgi:hypothetical protein